MHIHINRKKLKWIQLHSGADVYRAFLRNISFYQLCSQEPGEFDVCVCFLKLMNITLAEQCNLSYLSSQGIKPKETPGKVCRSSTLKEF